MEDIIVAVIGGSGFIGQHVVKELQRWQQDREVKVHKNEEVTEFAEETENVKNQEKNERIIKEILVLDLKPFQPVVDIEEWPIVKFRNCDIRIKEQIQSELIGVTAVIHCADIKPSFNQEVPKENDSLWKTNVEGTDNVIEACIKANVKALIYTSTVGVVMVGEKIICHSESLTPKVDENKLILGTFALSKRRGEKSVMEAHRTVTADGGSLSTIVLRPVAMYGEGDTKFVPYFIKMAKEAGGKLPPIGSPFAYHQLVYAGNVASAHVTALHHLLDGDHPPLQDCGGLPVYIGDDSIPGRSDDVLEPFLTPCGLATTQPTQYLFLTIWFSLLLSLWVAICKKLGNRNERIQLTPSTFLHRLAGATTIPGNLRAEIALHYKPKYSWEESKEASVTYYKSNQHLSKKTY